MKPISIDLRKRVIESYEEGLSFGQIGLLPQFPENQYLNNLRLISRNNRLETRPQRTPRQPQASSIA